MPEIKIDPKKIKKTFPTLEIAESMGTLSIYNYLNGNLTDITKLIENLESVSSLTTSLGEVIYPTIDLMKETREHLTHNRQKLLSLKKPELEEYEKSVQDYENIINKPKVREPQIQKFFEKNPILIDPRITKLIPKKSFGGEEFPDFIAILHNGEHILIEIEVPTKKIFTKRGHQTAKFSEADQQIQDYLRWANEEKEFLRKRELPNISIENTSGLLIIGMSKNLNTEQRKKFDRKKFECKNYKIKTFDEILMENQQIINSIRKHNK